MIINNDDSFFFKVSAIYVFSPSKFRPLIDNEHVGQDGAYIYIVFFGDTVVYCSFQVFL